MDWTGVDGDWLISWGLSMNAGWIDVGGGDTKDKWVGKSPFPLLFFLILSLTPNIIFDKQKSLLR